MFYLLNKKYLNRISYVIEFIFHRLYRPWGNTLIQILISPTVKLFSIHSETRITKWHARRGGVSRI